MSKAAGAGALTIEAAVLRAALADVVGVVERRTTIPVLANVLLRADQAGLLTITGTDLDMQVTRTVNAAVDRPFETTLGAALLAGIVGKLPKDAIVSLKLEEGRAIVAAGRARFTLATLPVDDFPAIAGRESEGWPATFEIDALVLGAALDRTAFAVSTEETRYYLNGVFLHRDEASLRFAATDGHRLARVVLELPDGPQELPAVIVPRKAVRALAGLLDRHEGRIEVAVRKGRLSFEVGATTLICKAIDGDFPDYTRVIPTANERRLRVDRAALAAAVERVATISSDKTRAVKVSLDRDQVTVSVSSPENGTAAEEVPAEYAAAPLEIGFNAAYVLEVLRHIAGETVEVELGDAAGPTLWRDAADSPATFVIMPMRV